MLLRDNDGAILAHNGIFRALGAGYRHTDVYGGRGGGKSVNVALWLLLRAMRRPGMTGLMLRVCSATSASPSTP